MASLALGQEKEQIRIEGKQDIQTKVLTTLFALFAEVERDLISERTREGLAKARSSGKKLGRPKGSLGVSRLDGKEDEIRHFLKLGVSKSVIAKITGVQVDLVSLHRLQKPPTQFSACIYTRIWLALVPQLHLSAPRQPRRLSTLPMSGRRRRGHGEE